MRPVDALYENGLLRPLSPLPLRSGERVALIVVRRPDPRRWDFTRLAAHGDDDLALAEAGRRPVIVWQSDTLTRLLQSVLVVPLTTNLDRAKLAGGDNRWSRRAVAP